MFQLGRQRNKEKSMYVPVKLACVQHPAGVNIGPEIYDKNERNSIGEGNR